MDPEQINKLIYPFTANFDEEHQRYYYYNTLTQESVWELPEEQNKKMMEFKKEYDEEKENPQSEEDDGAESDKDDKIMNQFLEKNYKKNFNKYKKELVDYMSRPARKQLEQSLASKIAYRQGDEEYNIWYDKFLTEVKQPVKEREAAQTRMVPETDTGYTKADLYEKYNSFFCMHFCKGSCSEGANCKYYHRCPSFKECQTIDNSRDIFGRPRFSKHKDDMSGIGSFMVETRTIQVSEFKSYNTPEALHVFGEIEDIVIKPNSALAYIRFQHRCMAEFAKEAMLNQSLDNGEVIQIKWAKDSAHNPQNSEEANMKLKDKNDKKILNKAMEKKQREIQLEAHKQQMQKNRQEFQEEKQKQQQEEILAKRQKKAQTYQNVQKFNSILEQIDQQDQSQAIKDIFDD